ncbi:hypothetical protein V2S66_02230 [Streptomyces sp. V4-01]|uniref:Uncharacterized protein n=1 Tax=Actinacidiphila polyblastidii TaxID=3110430 RepID=A0ABU7P4P9_9ACTN|nr:hypothetical protein [Streptomyces sp. V4-01]
MYSYEIQQARRDDLVREAAAWRLARDARAARTAERRAHRTEARTASRTSARTDAEGAASPSAPAPAPRPLGRVNRAPHPHRAA